LLSALVVLVAGVLTPVTSARAAHVNPPAGPPPASLGVRLVDIPVSEGADTRAWRYIIDHVPPGAVIRRRVLVDNLSPAAAQVSLYPDAATIKDGSFVGGGGATRSELTTWTRTSRRALTLAPRASAMVPVTIRVPRDASPGERYGVIWAQEAARVRAGRRFAVKEVNRVGVRIYLSVGPGGPPPTNFVIGSLRAARPDAGHPVVVARVANTGGRAVDLSGHLRLTDGPGGISAGPFLVQYGTTLAPGQAGAIRAVLGKRLPAGPWHVAMDLESGLTERHAHAIITFPGGTGRGIPAAMVRYLTVAALVVIAVIIAIFLRRFVRRHRRTPSASDSPAG